MRTTLALDDTLLEWARHEARQHDQSFTAYVEDALRHRLHNDLAARGIAIPRPETLPSAAPMQTGAAQT